MKSYLLLRDNQESGPFTLEQLVEKNLRPLDLIWIEGDSNSWMYAGEISALKDYVQEEEKSNGTKENKKVRRESAVFVALPTHYNFKNKDAVDHELVSFSKYGEPALETRYTRDLAEIKDQYVQHLKGNRFHFGKNSTQYKGLWLAALFLGLLLGAFTIKKIVDASGENVGTRSTAAASIQVNDMPATPIKDADPAYQNAIAKEVVPVDTSTENKAAKKTAKKIAVKKLVKINANNYKVGLFGGINDLKLTVNNRSEEILDKVTVEVQYLKPNGDLIQKEKLYLKGVAPKSEKTLEVPASKRGVKVNYKIINIQSHAVKTPMLQA